jgi:uncharacterized delta-60 repeat protein
MGEKFDINFYAWGIHLLLCLALGIFIPLVGLNSQSAMGGELVQDYLPLLVKRHVSFVESSGILDTSFDQDGLVLTDLSAGADFGTAMVLLPDGKLLVGGEVSGTYNVDVGVARYNPDGSLDTTFGTGGWVSTDLYGNDEAAAIAVQPDGKILLGCTAVFDFYLVRYNMDGNLDAAFGTGGWVRTDFLGSEDEAKAVAVQPDGRIIVAGYAMDSNYKYDFALVRYLADGSLDTSFGVGGKVTTDLTGDNDQARGIAIQPDGKIIVVGPAKHTGYFHDFAVARYNSNGTLDASFGTNGWVFTHFGGAHDFAYAVALQTDGKIVVAGAAEIYVENLADYRYAFAVARYTSNGSLDTTFDGDGKVITDFSQEDDYGYAVALQPDGKVIVAGYANNGTNNDFTVVRYNPNGSLDPGFSGDGKVMTDIAGGDDKGLAVVLQMNGRIVLAGSAVNGTDADFALARYR